MPPAAPSQHPELLALEADHAALASEVREHLAPRVERLEEAAANMRGMIQEINVKLSGTATREDIAGLESRLGTRIDAGINGILQKALDAIPAHQALSINRMMMIWTAITALATIGALIWGHIL